MFGLFLVFRALATDDSFDDKVAAELQASNPAAVADWDAANAARDAGEHEAAVARYAAVEAAAPGFFHATRRRCGELLQLGNVVDAEAACRAAVATERTPENLRSLAQVLLTHEGETPTAAALEVERLADEAVAADPTDVTGLLLQCQANLVLSDVQGLGVCSRAIIRHAPEEMAGHYFAAYAWASEGDFDAAQASLDRAHDRGLDDETYARFSAGIEENRPAWPGILQAALGVTVAWFAVLGLLWLSGTQLSAMTLRAAAQAPSGNTGAAVGLSSRIRGLYGSVLWLSCAFYYLSIPLLILATLGLGGGILFAVFAVGYIPIKLVVIVLVVVVVSVFALLKSLFVRARDEDPGERLDLAAHPRLSAVLGDVAERVGTRKVDTVFLTPGTDVAVFERGGLGKQLRGTSERCLVLGVGVLDGFRLRPFKAVLAHEYGHFSNQDTAGGGFALRVRRSVNALARGLIEGGAAGISPAWLFLRGFMHVFLRISQGASRLQEVLADRWAAFTYGATAFEEGLRHVIARSVGFDAHASATLHEVVTAQKGLSNLYSFAPEQGVDATEVARNAEEALSRAPTEFDSHPAPLQRFAWVHALGATGVPAAEDDDAPVWELFSDREALERQMTDQIRANVAMAHSVVIGRG